MGILPALLLAFSAGTLVLLGFQAGGAVLPPEPAAVTDSTSPDAEDDAPPSVPSRYPLPYRADRPLLLTFGLRVAPDPAENPIDPPERFTGWHAATDFEVLPDEEDTDVRVSALCDGTVLRSGFTSGYGGLVVTSCVLDGQDVTVLYGHLLLSDLPAVGTTLPAGAHVGTLGPAYSRDTHGNRKHLHLGVHLGKEVGVRGYVESQSDLSEFLNPLTLLR